MILVLNQVVGIMKDYLCFTEYERDVLRYSQDDVPGDRASARGVFSGMSDAERQMAFDELEGLIGRGRLGRYKELVDKERSERIRDESLSGATIGAGAGLALALRQMISGKDWSDVHPTAALAAVPLMSGLGYLVGRGAGYLMHNSPEEVDEEYYNRAMEKSKLPRSYASRPSGLTKKEEDKLVHLFLSDPRIGNRITPSPWLEAKGDVESRGRSQWLRDALALGLGFGGLGAAVGGIGTDAILRASGVESDSLPWVGAGLGGLLAGGAAARIGSKSAQEKYLEKKKLLDELDELDRVQGDLDSEYRREVLMDKFGPKSFDRVMQHVSPRGYGTTSRLSELVRERAR